MESGHKLSFSMSVDHEPEALPSPSRAAAPVQFSADKVKPPAAAPSFNSKLRTGDIIYLTLEQDSSGGGEFEAKCAYVAAEGLADPRVGLVVKPESGNDSFARSLRMRLAARVRLRLKAAGSSLTP